MATAYWTDEKLTALGKEVLDRYHEDKIVHPADFAFIFRDPPANSGDRAAYGKARKVTEAMRAAGVDAYFLIEIASVFWNAASREKRVAMLDHELCHCQVEEKTDKDGLNTGELVRKTKPHDVEEFHEIIRRHGAWNSDLTEVPRQLKLFGEEDKT